MTRFKITLLLFFYSIVPLISQVEQGTVPLGGVASLQLTAADPAYESFTSSISPFFGYYLNDDFGITGGFSWASQNLTIDNYPNANDVWERDLDGFNLFLAARHYFPFLDYRMFGQVDLINQNTEFGLTLIQNGESRSQSFTNNIFSMKGSLGTTSFLSENIAIEGILKYTLFKRQSIEDRPKVLKGPIEFIVDIRPYVNTGWSPGNTNHTEYIDAGSWNIGGTAGVSHSLLENRRIIDSLILDNQVLGVWLEPKFGYFFGGNFLVGLTGTINYADDNANNPVSFAAAPYIRYYIRATQGLQVVPNFSMVYNYVLSRQKILGEDSVSKTFIFSPGLGLHTFLTEGIGLFANGVMSFRQIPTASGTALNPSKFTSLQLQIGLEYYLSDF